MFVFAEMLIHRVRVLCLVFILCSAVMCNVGRPVAPELQELRKRWGASDIIRDLDHIKQDVQKITKLQDSGDITTNEALFYFLRMHDFDDNRKLDGHELLAAMTHALEHQENEKPMSIEEKESVSQESSYVIECIRDIIPQQIYNDCCIRENNCTVSRQQNRAIDCMSRIIMTNSSSFFTDSRENGPGTTDMSFSHNRNNQYYSEIFEALGEMCRRQPRARLQNCIRNELIKRCRYSMLQDRFTSSPARWGQRRTDMDMGFNDGRMEPRRRGHFFNGGGRHQPDGFLMMGRPTDSRHYSSREGGYSDDMDDEDFGYSDSDSMRFK